MLPTGTKWTCSTSSGSEIIDTSTENTVEPSIQGIATSNACDTISQFLGINDNSNNIEEISNVDNASTENV
jgi:hypothetical protein